MMPRSIEMMSEDAKVILLLCGHLGETRELVPLTLSEYNRVARWLRGAAMRPADLLKPDHIPALAREAALVETRLRALLGRGMQLALAVEGWNQSGIWVVCRSDLEYPARCKSHLGDQAPAVLFGVGCRPLLSGGGLAIVGSRDVDDEGKVFAEDIAARCARGGVPVVSGGARGVDEVAMTSALAAGGTVIGVLADKLLHRSVTREARAGLADGLLLLLSPYHPEAGFNTGNAMGRNKLIYAFADYGLVVCADYDKGGTWEGAVEELKRKPGRPIFVRLEGAPPAGNKKLVDRGAIAFPELRDEQLTPEWLKQAAGAESVLVTADEIPLFQGYALPQRTPDMVKEPQQVLREEPCPIETSRPPVPASVYDAVLFVILAALGEPKSAAELATRLDVSKVQMSSWLKRAVDEGVIRKLKRPVRYARKDD